MSDRTFVVKCALYNVYIDYLHRNFINCSIDVTESVLLVIYLVGLLFMFQDISSKMKVMEYFRFYTFILIFKGVNKRKLHY